MRTLRTLDDAVPRPAPDFTRLLKVLRRDGRPDHVPFYELFANPEIQEALLGHPMKDQASTVEFYHRAGYDYVPVWPTLTMKVGSLIDTTDDYPIKDWETFERYDWPEPSAIGYEGFDAVAACLPEGMRIIGQTGGVFERAEELFGYVGLCTLLALDRELVRAVFDRIGMLWEAIYRGMASIDAVGAVVISDDLGFKTQTLISPDDLREFVLPWHRRLAQAAHDHGKPCILHSCGQLAAVMDDIIEGVGIDAKHSYEDQILPVTEAKARYGDRIAILGGYDVDRLCRNTPEEVRAHTRMLLDTCGSNGGYALGSGNSIAAFVPLENYLTMLNEGWLARSGN